MKPKLRFQGFHDDWEEKKLGEISTVYSGGTPKSTVKEYYQGNIPFIRSGEIHSNMTELAITHEAIENSSAKWVNKGDLLYAMYGATAGDVSISKIKGVINQAILCINTNQNKKFIEQYLTLNKDKYLTMYLQGGQGNLSSQLIKNYNIFLPSILEQEKIGAFLSQLDDRIEKQEQKIALLKERKKGWMQQLFSQTIRFKDENRQDYPAWEEKQLGEIGNTFTGLSGKTKEDFGHGDAKFITFVNVLNNTIAKCNGVDNIEIDKKQNEVKYGDIMFTTSSETPEEVGMSSLWLGKDSNIYLNSFCFGYRLNDEVDISYHYLAYLLRSQNVRKQFIKLAQGISRYNISKTKVMDILISTPSLPEQEKIAEFLSKQDELIEKEEEKLSLLKEQKKGLIQQMFV